MDGHILLPLSGFKNVAFGRMRSAQLHAALFDHLKATRRNVQIYIEIEGRTEIEY